jgi:hypothetical protein
MFLPIFEFWRRGISAGSFKSVGKNNKKYCEEGDAVNLGIGWPVM